MLPIIQRITNRFKSIANHFKARALEGFMLWIAIAITASLLKFVFDKADTLFPSLTQLIIGKSIPGMNVLLIIFIFYISGAGIAHPLGKKLKFKDRFQGLFMRIPLFGNLYSLIRPIFENLFSAGDKDSQKPVVIVEGYTTGIFDLGLKVSEVKLNGVQEIWIVFLPTVPMPNSGRSCFIPREKIYEIYIDSQTSEREPLAMTRKELEKCIERMSTQDCAGFIFSIGSSISGNIYFKDKDGHFLEKI